SSPPPVKSQDSGQPGRGLNARLEAVFLEVAENSRPGRHRDRSLRDLLEEDPSVAALKVRLDPREGNPAAGRTVLSPDQVADPLRAPPRARLLEHERRRSHRHVLAPRLARPPNRDVLNVSHNLSTERIGEGAGQTTSERSLRG